LLLIYARTGGDRLATAERVRDLFARSPNLDLVQRAVVPAGGPTTP
jgi:hypothetical protein